MFKGLKNRSGQALVELLIGVSVGALILGSSATVIIAVVNSNSKVAKLKTATQLGQELMDNVRVLADSNWKAFYQLDKGSSNHYYASTTTPFSAISGNEVVNRNNIEYTRWFFVENVNRATSGDNIDTEGGVIDPSTQKVIVRVAWDGADGITFTRFITRHRNFIVRYSDWSGGLDDSYVSNNSNNLYSAISNISTTTVEQISLDSLDSGGFLVSATFDTGLNDRGVLNFIIWQGIQPSGTVVRFQMASSNNTDDPWSYIGPDGTDASYYTSSGPGSSIIIRQNNHLHKRYFRYKLYLDSDSGNSLTPIVKDVIISYYK